MSRGCACSRPGVTMARILVVDDDPSMLAALEALLSSAGYEAVVAPSGKEALGFLDAGIEAVVTDYSMPEMNGLELIQVIGQRDETPPSVPLTPQGLEAGHGRRHG